MIVEIDKLCEEGKIEGITTIRDETNRTGVRFVIEVAKGVSTEPIIAKLFKLTRLEETYSFNQVALVDKKPQLLNMKQLLEIYINHQKDVLLRKSKFEAKKIANRLHIDSILVKSLVRSSEKWYTKVNRLRETAILQKIKIEDPQKFEQIERLIENE